MQYANIARTQRARRGFTLVELLVVVLILAILMAVALPLYLSAVKDSQRKTCRANLQTIANAVHTDFVKKNGVGGYTTAIGSLPDLQATPKCPNNGNYTVVTPGTTNGVPYEVKCDYNSTEHGKYEPGVDAN